MYNEIFSYYCLKYFGIPTTIKSTDAKIILIKDLL